MVDGIGHGEVTGADFQLPAVFEKLITSFKAGKLPYQFKIKPSPGKEWRGYKQPDDQRPAIHIYKGGGDWPESTAAVQFSGTTDSFKESPVKVILGLTISKEQQWNDKPVLRISYRSPKSEIDDYRTPINEFDFVVESASDLDAFTAEIKKDPKLWEVFLRRIDPDILEVMPLAKQDQMFLELEDARRSPWTREFINL